MEIKLLNTTKQDKLIDEIYKASRKLSFAMSLLSSNAFNCKQRSFDQLKEVSISLTNLEREIEND